MFQKSLHKVWSVAMALFVLMSTFSFAMEKHFCGDVLVDVAIFSDLTTCGMDMKTTSDVILEKNDCCKDEIEMVKGQDKLKKTSFEEFRFGQLLFIKTLIYSYNNLFEDLPKQIASHQDYSPPNLVFDIQILCHVFII